MNNNGAAQESKQKPPVVDAHKMLEQALQQMDGIIASKSNWMQNYLFINRNYHNALDYHLVVQTLNIRLSKW